MRYAALNQGADDLASFSGFVPSDFPAFRTIPDPSDRRLLGRYSDEQLYALALYLYSLRPPPNPNKFDAAASRGKRVFQREGCGGCHTPPLYTNNKLTPVEGFAVPKKHLQVCDFSRVSRHRSGTRAAYTPRNGILQGSGVKRTVVSRDVPTRWLLRHARGLVRLSAFARRLRSHGLHGVWTESGAVKGPPFGLDLTPEEKRDLMAFLRTL